LPSKKEKWEFGESFKQDVCLSMMTLLQNSKTASKWLIEEGVIEQIAIKAKESTEAYFLESIRV